MRYNEQLYDYKPSNYSPDKYKNHNPVQEWLNRDKSKDPINQVEQPSKKTEIKVSVTPQRPMGLNNNNYTCIELHKMQDPGMEIIFHNVFKTKLYQVCEYLVLMEKCDAYYSRIQLRNELKYKIDDLFYPDMIKALIRLTSENESDILSLLRKIL